MLIQKKIFAKATCMLKGHIATTIEMLAKEYGKSEGTIDMLRIYKNNNQHHLQNMHENCYCSKIGT